MSAVSNKVTPRSSARWITLREASRSVRWPKLLQPRPTTETRRPEPPRLRICMMESCKGLERDGEFLEREIVTFQAQTCKVRSYRAGRWRRMREQRGYEQ